MDCEELHLHHRSRREIIGSRSGPCDARDHRCTHVDRCRATSWWCRAGTFRRHVSQKKS